MFHAFALMMRQQESTQRKEAMTTKALQSVVGILDQFDGRNISKYLIYSREMELNKVPEKEMVSTFELAVVPELREHVQGVARAHGATWEAFSTHLKEEYTLEDADRVTKKSFLEWVNTPNKRPPPIPTVQQAPAAPTPTTQVDVMEELVKGMRDLQIKLARLEEKETGVATTTRPMLRQDRVQRCIWCDGTDHAR
ncbi:hypothetical protein R1sor_014869 [Riccia sorocarpa]|uniref:Uncharacterized protein n=1 Tax=Riccia sorocarpa TaxID=122646 RepID=A0ABD3HAM5_9MARC